MKKKEEELKPTEILNKPYPKKEKVSGLFQRFWKWLFG